MSDLDYSTKVCMSVFLQYDPETSPSDDLPFKSAPQVMLAYCKYQWSLADDVRRRQAFHRLQVWFLILPFFFKHFSVWTFVAQNILTIFTVPWAGHCSRFNRPKWERVVDSKSTSWCWECASFSTYTLDVGRLALASQPCIRWRLRARYSMIL